MRRSFALLAALAVMPSLAVAPAAAAVPLRVNDTRVLSPGATTKIEVAAQSGIDITKVRAVAAVRITKQRLKTRLTFSIPERLTGPSDHVDVRYRTRILDFNAAPEPVNKGGTVTVVGTLQRETTGWLTYASKAVKFYFLPKGSSTWTYMGTQTTDKSGRFRKGFKATQDGTWRAYSSATASYVATYREDYVDVR
ncbi:hypothetical protein ETD83_24290 [Actinomadura soli]|uniref:Uncharacterized protein n=1 Tax=Actinomadura soli TaxID=2508997 RepID=A0A5C4J7A4_9ACTN|nr:hypothetical protein [Actinomadura soli]TMQ94218.1 hypothetical protein ETD83_24290 [Actinomadura soli]